VSDQVSEDTGDAMDDPINDSGSVAPTAKAVLAHIVKSIVDDPDTVTVDEVANGNKARFDVRVGPGELGRVIGRRGRTAASIRTVARAAASKDGTEIDIEFVD
jgi:hypothetical protein